MNQVFTFIVKKNNNKDIIGIDQNFNDDLF